METDPTPSPLRVRVDQREFVEITAVIVEEGVLTLIDDEGWCTSMAPGSWSQASRVDETKRPDVPGADPRNLL